MKNHIKIEYELIKDMRINHNAPVDTMGCHLFSDDKLDKNISNFHVIVGAFLSSQTQDKITFESMQRLKKKNLSIDFILNTPTDILANIIKPVGFHNKKAITLKKICKILKDEYKYIPPISYDELIKLPGIGSKMACLIVNVIQKDVCGICVDTHVHRITNRLGWVNTKKPEKTKYVLEDIIDKKYWNEINPLLVGFGQTICKAIKPKCDICLLKNKCKYYNEKYMY